MSSGLKAPSRSDYEKWWDFIEFLETIDFVGLLSEYGEFVYINGDYVGTCPFHQGRLPSLVVFGNRMSFQCADPKCGAQGDILELLSQIEKTDRDATYAKLIERCKDYYIAPSKIDRDRKLDVYSNNKSRKIDLPQYLQPLLFDKDYFPVFPVYSQTRLHSFHECQLRYWYQYVEGINVDRLTTDITVGILVHLVLRDFFRLPKENRTLDSLFNIFLPRWGKLSNLSDFEDECKGRAIVALENAYKMNLGLQPVNVETEVPRSMLFPSHKPKWKLTSKVDRIDWYSASEYDLIDYKTNQAPLSVDEAKSDFQTLLYYLIWTTAMRGLTPRRISYQ